MEKKYIVSTINVAANHEFANYLFYFIVSKQLIHEFFNLNDAP